MNYRVSKNKLMSLFRKMVRKKKQSKNLKLMLMTLKITV